MTLVKSPSAPLTNTDGEELVLTTAAQFQLFKDEFQKWIPLLGLTGYRITYNKEVMDGSQAMIYINEEGRTARVAYARYLTKKGYTNHDVRYAARHEAVHLLLSRLTYMAASRYAIKKEIDHEEENLAVLLGKLLGSVDLQKVRCPDAL
jgi:hypothetical protein